jgi:hypothetical protein
MNQFSTTSQASADRDFQSLIEMGVVPDTRAKPKGVRYFTAQELGIEDEAPQSSTQRRTPSGAATGDQYLQGGPMMAFAQGAKRYALDKPAAMLEQGFNRLRGDDVAYRAVQDRERNYDAQIAGVGEQNPKSMFAGKVAGGVGLSIPIGGLAGAAIPGLAVNAGLRSAMGNAALTGAATEGIQYNPDESWQDKAKNMGLSGALGAGVTGVLGKAASALTQPFRSTLTPEKQAVIDAYRDIGGRVPMGVARDSSMLQSLERGAAQAPLSSRVYDGLRRDNAGVAEQAFTKAIGSNAARPTPEAVQLAKDAHGKIYQDISARNDVVLGRQVENGLKAVERQARGRIEQSKLAPLMTEIRDAMSPNSQYQGIIPGDLYQTFRSELAGFARGASNDVEKAQFQAVKKVLDKAFDASVSKADSVLKKSTDVAYANTKLAEKALKNNVIGQTGTVNERQLSAMLSKVDARKGGKVDDELQRVANYAQAFPSLPDSGTARNMLYNPMTLLAGAMGGGGATLGAAIPGMAVGGGLLGMNAGLHKVMQSPMGQKLLLDGLRPNVNPNLIGYGGGLLGMGAAYGQ